MATDRPEDRPGAPGVVDFWNSLPPMQKVLLGVVAGALMLAFIFLAGTAFRPAASKVPLLAGYAFPPDELAAAVRALAAANVTEYEQVGNQLLVPRGREVVYLAALGQANALPGNFYQAFDDYVTRQSTWWASNQKDQRLFREAKARTLAKVIEAYEEIERAAVNVSESPPLGLRRKGRVTASVQVFTKGRRPLNPLTADNIKTLLAGAFAIASNDVTVVADTPRADAAANGRNLSSEYVEAKSPYLQTIVWYEERIQQKLAELFKSMDGVEVTAHVDVSPEMNRQKQSSHFEKGVPATSETTERTSGTGGGAQPGGEPGPAANVDLRARPNQGATTASTSTESEETTRTSYHTPTMTMTWQTADFGLQKVAGVVIRVPRQFLEPAAAQAGEAPEPAQITEADIQGAVLALGLPGLSTTNIKVLRYTLPEPAAPVEPTWFTRILEVLSEHMGSILLGVFALAAITGAFWVIRRTPVPQLPPLPVPEVGREELPEAKLPELPTDEAGRRFQKLEEAITDMVAKDATIAGAMVRRWVQEAE